MSACVLPMNDVVCAPIILYFLRTRLPFDCGNLIIFFHIGTVYNQGNKGWHFFGSIFHKTNEMWNNEKKEKKKRKEKNTWPLEYFKGKKSTSEKKMLNRSQKSLNILWIFFCVWKIIFGFDVIGSLIHVYWKTFVN